MKAQAEHEVSSAHVEAEVAGLNWGRILSWVVVLMPLALWLPRYGWNDLFAVPGLYVTLAKFGSLVGTAMMAWSIILSARYRFLDHIFFGLDKMYKLHHLFGAAAFALILWHALWLTIKFQAQSPTGLVNLWNSPYFAVRLGVVALVSFIVLMFLTVMVKMSYDWFVRIHRWLGGMFLLGALHGFLVRGQMDVNPPLFWYMMILVCWALWSFVYHSLLNRLLVFRYRYEVKDVHHFGEGVVEICLKRRGRPLLFAPGQFGYLSFEAKGFTEPHPYSISSGNQEPLVRFTIKALGDYTQKLMDLKPGTKATIEGPFGAFSYLNGHRKKQVWVAGGIGITPFLSMARNFKRRYHADLYYCVKTEGEMVFANELTALSDKSPGFHLIPICEDTDGFISAGTINKVSKGLTDKDFFICGPPVMMDALVKQLKELGVTDEQIHIEDFRY